MVLKARHKRFILIVIGLVLIGLAARLILNAFQSNMVFFYTPTHPGEEERRRWGRVNRLRCTVLKFRALGPSQVFSKADRIHAGKSSFVFLLRPTPNGLVVLVLL